MILFTSMDCFSACLCFSMKHLKFRLWFSTEYFWSSENVEEHIKEYFSDCFQAQSSIVLNWPSILWYFSSMINYEPPNTGLILCCPIIYFRFSQFNIIENKGLNIQRYLGIWGIMTVNRWSVTYKKIPKNVNLKIYLSENR